MKLKILFGIIFLLLLSSGCTMTFLGGELALAKYQLDSQPTEMNLTIYSPNSWAVSKQTLSVQFIKDDSILIKKSLFDSTGIVQDVLQFDKHTIIQKYYVQAINVPIEQKVTTIRAIITAKDGSTETIRSDFILLKRQ